MVTYILIVFGGYVASSESGMGCGPEWPLCNGEVIPVMQGETLIEFAHRAIGLLLFIIVVVLFALIRRTNSNKRLQTAGLWMICLLTLQVLAGAIVVILDLPTIVITIHLVVAMLFMLNLLWIFRAEQQDRLKVSLGNKKLKAITTHLNVLIILLLLTMGVGAFIKHEYYGLACNWLNCNDTWLPMTRPEILQTLHRIIAVITATYTILLTFLAYSKNWEERFKRRLLLASLIVLIQLISGVLTVVTNISIPWAVVHLAIGTALFMIIADARVSLGSTVTRNKSEKWTNQSGQPINKI